MSMTLSGNGTITGLVSGGLPDGTVLPADLSTGGPYWDTSGNLLIGKTSATANGGDVQVSKGITFPATQVACSDANTLDDYEEGTWTPSVSPSTSGAFSISSATGKYTKIGNVVTVQLGISFTKNTAVGVIYITGFPWGFTGTGTNFSVRGPSFDWYEQSGTALIAMRGIGINGSTNMIMYALTAANTDGTGRTWDATDTSTINTQVYSVFSYLI